MALGEFDLIARYFSDLGQAPGVVLGVGDDCALLEVPTGQQLAVSLDTLVEGVHFPADADPEAVGWRALAVNLSDLAAMGATPAWLTLGLTLPEADPEWLEGFSRGLAELARHAGVQLVGGDTTRGPRCLSLQVHGWVPAGQALRRDGARPGDLIYVTGTLGDSAAGLAQWQNQRPDPDPWLAQRFMRPEPRLAWGQRLRGLASAAIDLSDGLVSDLGHILQRSGVAARVERERLPLSRPLREAVAYEQALTWALSGGEDFELCFTLPPERRKALEALGKLDGVGCTCIGVIDAGDGLRVLDAAGAPCETLAGYRHF